MPSPGAGRFRAGRLFRRGRCEHAFVPPPPAPVVRARLDRALTMRDLSAVRAAARESPSIVTLADAVQILMLMLEADDPAFEGASVRWLARFTTECAGVTLGEAQAALEALEAL